MNSKSRVCIALAQVSATTKCFFSEGFTGRHGVSDRHGKWYKHESNHRMEWTGDLPPFFWTIVATHITSWKNPNLAVLLFVRFLFFRIFICCVSNVLVAIPLKVWPGNYLRDPRWAANFDCHKRSSTMQHPSPEFDRCCTVLWRSLWRTRTSLVTKMSRCLKLAGRLHHAYSLFPYFSL